MKKLLTIITCLFLFGCQSGKETFHDTDWLGTYINGDVSLQIVSLQEDEGLDFCVSYGDKYINGYAFFDETNSHIALYEAEEDGHALNFQLKNDKITIKESGAITYFEIDISGQYKKQ